MGKNATRKRTKDSPEVTRAAQTRATTTTSRGVAATKVLSSSAFRDPLQLSQGSEGEPFTEEENVALAPNSLDGSGSDTAPNLGPRSRFVAIAQAVAREAAVLPKSDDVEAADDMVPSSIESNHPEPRQIVESPPPSDPASQDTQTQTQKRKRAADDLTVAFNVRRRISFSQHSPVNDENSVPIGTFGLQLSKIVPESPELDSMIRSQPVAGQAQSPAEPHATQSPTQLSQDVQFGQRDPANENNGADPENDNDSDNEPQMELPSGAPSPSRPMGTEANVSYFETMFKGLKQLQDSSDALKTENKKLKAKLAKLEEESKTAEAKHAKEISSLKKKHEEAGTKFAEDKRNIEDLLAKAKASVSATKLNLQKNSELAEQRLREVEELQGKLDEAHTREAVTKTELARLKSDNEEVTKAYERLQIEFEGLRNEMDVLRTENSRLEGVVAGKVKEEARIEKLLKGMSHLLTEFHSGRDTQSQELAPQPPQNGGGFNMFPDSMEDSPKSQEPPIVAAPEPIASSGGGRITSPAEPGMYVPSTVIKPRSPRKGALTLKETGQPRARRRTRGQNARVLVNDSDSGEGDE